ncbi:MAG TPA: Maf family protein [Caulobacteraceae bacterium]|jgi:septum formation protein|nr:Maf family protein [Caulobacteraceae bacterium]
MTPVILASKSTARAAVLLGAGVLFETVGSGVDEEAVKQGLLAERASPRDIADSLAELKAVRVSGRRPGLVIGADQTLELDGALVDKAETLEDARERLLSLRGRTHILHSAVVVARGGAPIWREVKSARMSVRQFTTAWLDGYLTREGEALLGSVGCYRLESEGVQLFDRIDGDYFTILGLPLVGLLDILRKHGALTT